MVEKNVKIKKMGKIGRFEKMDGKPVRIGIFLFQKF